MTLRRLIVAALAVTGLAGCAGLFRAGQDPGRPGAAEVTEGPFPDRLRERDDRLFRKSLQWPLYGTVSSGFGGRGSGVHRGIDILAPRGSEVRAAGVGLVLYCGTGLRGYGRTVILDHGEEVTTLYGHLDEIRVKSGDAVPGGEVVGTVGKTGNATTYHLHFELRIGDDAVDPVKYLQRTDGSP